MCEITNVIIDSVNKAERVLRDWVYQGDCLINPKMGLGCDVDFEDYVIAESWKVNDDGSISMKIGYNEEPYTLPFETLQKETNRMYRTIEYIGNGNYKCEEYREWEGLDDEQKEYFKEQMMKYWEGA